MIEERYAILDIETRTIGDTPDPEQDIPLYVGMKGYHGNRVCYHISETEKIQKAIGAFKYLVGHNIKEYDQPILERVGFSFKDNIVIDTLEITAKRVKAMMYIDLAESGKSLGALCELFNLNHRKGEFDYDLLKQEQLSSSEYEQLVEYLYGDLDATEELFLYYYDFFFGFREYMSDRDKEKMSWLTCSSGTTAYKVICNLAGLREEYEKNVNEDIDPYAGGYVSEPYVDEAKGDIYCRDFSSLYPTMMRGGCLYSPVASGEQGWNGNTGYHVYPSEFSNEEDGIKGTYRRHHGPVEKVLTDLYNKRMEVTDRLKSETDPAQKDKLKKQRLAIKILINTVYGIMGCQTFKSVYTRVGASDCTAMARRSIKHARTMLQRYGYEVLYTDTDSAYILDHHKDRQRLQGVCTEIVRRQRESMNVPIESHSFVEEYKIKHIWFFKDDAGNYVKKTYVFLKEDGDIGLKGLKVIRGECSKLTVKVWDEILEPQFKTETYTPMTYEQALEIVKKYAVENTELLAKRYRVKDPSTYANDKSIQSQIAKRYGAGEHWLIPNRRLGPGKKHHYCTKEELVEKYGEEWIDVVRLETYLGEMKSFIIVEDRKKIEK